MKLFSLLFVVAVLANCYATENPALEASPMAAEPAVQAPTTSPTKAANVQVSPGEGITVVENKVESGDLLIELPTFVNHSLQAEESKPLAATGLITKDGDIYEIENKNVIDQVQSRQAQDDVQHICNYGSVLIYSDVPCKQLNKVRVSESGETTALDANPNASAEKKKENAEKNVLILVRPNQRPNKRPNQRPNKRPNHKPNKRPNQKPNKRPNQKPGKRPNPNAQKPNNKNKHKRPNQQSGQKRPNQNGQNRPLNNGQNRPLNTNNNRQNLRQQQINQLLWQQEEADDYDDELYFQNQRRRPQTLRYISDYDAYGY